MKQTRRPHTPLRQADKDILLAPVELASLTNWQRAKLHNLGAQMKLLRLAILHGRDLSAPPREPRKMFEFSRL